MASIALAGSRTRGYLNRTLSRLFAMPDLAIFGLLIAGLNMHLLGIGSGTALIFIPEAVAEGEWWRMLTHPFVHITGYHFLLDAGAFVMLYADLKTRPLPARLLIVVLCAGTSLAAALAFSPLVDRYGLCGLSGIAHGLMAFSGLEMMTIPRQRRFGTVTFLLVLIKSIYELAAGEVLFDFMHMGLCGTPVAACHFGGVAGGVIAFLVSKWQGQALIFVSTFFPGCSANPLFGGKTGFNRKSDRQ